MKKNEIYDMTAGRIGSIESARIQVSGGKASLFVVSIYSGAKFVNDYKDLAGAKRGFANYISDVRNGKKIKWEKVKQHEHAQ